MGFLFSHAHTYFSKDIAKVLKPFERSKIDFEFLLEIIVLEPHETKKGLLKNVWVYVPALACHQPLDLFH